MLINRIENSRKTGINGNLFTKNKLCSLKEIVFSAIILVFIANSSFATTYYVSSTGNDSNSGTSATQAWLTLDKVNSVSFSPGDKILFNRGDEWVGTLTITSSGTSGSPIVFGAYGSGNKPKIYNSTEVSGWSVYSEKIYRAPVSASSMDRVFIDDSPVRSARYPNSGYFSISSVSSTTQFKSTEISSSIDYTGAVAVFRDNVWSTATTTVTSSSSQTLTIASAPLYALNAGEGFVLLNNLKFLDAPGEWYYDKTNQYLYLWTPNGDSPANYTVRASVKENAVVISSENYITIENLELAHSNGNAITLGDCDYITINNCDLSYPDNIGLEITSTSSKYVTFTNNTVVGANHDGIRTYGTYHTFENNTIKDIGLFDDFGVGGLGMALGKRGIIVLGGYCTVKYNHVENTGYNGIAFFTAPYTTIENNYITNACLTTQDGGGIYCYNTSVSDPGCQYSEVRGNIIDNVPGNIDGCTTTTKQGVGIYMDDRIHHITIEDNTVTGASSYAIYLHNNKYITVSNNTLFDNANGFRATGSFGASDNTVQNNIFLNTASSGSSSPATLGILNSDESSIVDINSNKYIDKHRTTPFANTKDYSYKTYAQWKALTGQDANSTFDGTALDEGKSEVLIYNNTQQAKTFSLGSSIYVDVDGNQVSGSVTLQAFASKILIGTKATSIESNESPEIQDQTIEINSDIKKDGSVGQVIASDPDDGQTLTYSITGGNDEGLFYIDSSTGEIFAREAISTSESKTIELTVAVTDDGSTSLSASATVTISIVSTTIISEGKITTDITAPTIVSFSVSETSSSLTVSVLAFEATDDTGVTGYLITEDGTSPDSEDSDWSTSALKSYTFTTSGTYTLYAWTKDEQGNVSETVTATVTISIDNYPFSEYLFEEASGTTVYDSQGDNNGTIMNSEVRSEGVIGSGLELDGSNYVSMGDCFSSNITDEVTLSAWIKPNTSYTGYQGIIMHGGADSDTYAMYISSDYKRIAFKTTGTTSAAWFYVDNIDIWDGEWHNITLTYDGAEKIIYVDDEAVATTSESGDIASGIGYNLLIGAGRDTETPTLLYKGLIDEVRIYNYALSADEVSALYNRVTPETVYATENVDICEGDEYNSWTEAGTYERTLTAANGADSIVTTKLTVNPTYEITEEVTIKEGESYLDWTEEGEYKRVLTSSTGCDSTIITTLTVLTKISTTESIEICEGDEYLDWTEAGTYGRTLTAANGADSVVTTKLTVNPSYEITEKVTIKEGENYLNWTETGEYTRALISSTGCDSTVITLLTVLEKIYTTDSITICDGDEYLGWTEAGTYETTFTASNGADSIVTTEITVNPTYEITEEITIAEGESYLGWTEEGEYKRVLTSSTGCDSIVTTILELQKLNAPFSEYLFEETSGTTVYDSQADNDGTIINTENRSEGVIGSGLKLDGTNYVSLGEIFAENVEDQLTLSAWVKPNTSYTGYQGVIMHGGSSTDTYAMYINSDNSRVAFKTTGTTSSAWFYADNVNLWDGEWHNITLTYNGSKKVIYVDDEEVASADDSGNIASGVGYNLLIGAGRDSETPTLLYKGLIDEVRIYNYALSAEEVSAIYKKVYPDPVYTTESIEICDGDEYLGWTETGTYERTLTAISGADSIVTTELTVNPTYEITEEVTISEGESYNDWTEAGEYKRALTSSTGCDSTVITILTVQKVYAPFSEYLFEETSGTTVFDSQADNDGTIMNSEIRTEGIEGNGLQLNGTNYVSLGEVFAENVTDELTLSAWVKPDASTSGYQGVIMHGGAADDTYAMYIYSAAKRIAFKTTGTSSAAWFTVDNINIWDGEWHNITLTYDGAEKIIYVDDVAVASTEDSGNIASGTGYNLLIGAGRDTQTPTLLYKGLIDEVRIYNYALSPDAVSEIYNKAALEPVYATETIEICEGDEYLGWTEAGTYERTLTASSGADSIVTTELTVNPTYEITEEITIKKGEDYLGWTDEGEYLRVLTSSTGCDSTVITVLTVRGGKGNKTPYSSSSSLTDQDTASTATYTDATAIEFNGLETEREFTVYPNPASSHVTIDYASLPDMNTTVEIINSNGRVVYKTNVEAMITSIDINNLNSGMYLVRSISNNQASIKKLIVE